MKKHKKSARRERHDRGPLGQGHRGRHVDDSGQLDIARCPACGGPMTARLGKRGPYFHCRCHSM